jgi:hypothetical protein
MEQASKQASQASKQASKQSKQASKQQCTFLGSHKCLQQFSQYPTFNFSGTN